MPIHHLQTEPDVYLIEGPIDHAIVPATNCYVVKDDGDCAVIDTGSPWERGYQHLDAQLNELGVERSRASFILTHVHFDHAGLIDRIAPPQARLYVGRSEYNRTLRSNVDRVLNEMLLRLPQEGVSASEVDTFVTMYERSTEFSTPAHNPLLVGEGDKIIVGRYSLSVLDLPGHTSGHIGLYEPSSQTLFCGDHVLGLISPCIETPSGSNDNLGDHLSSLERVANLPVRLLAWGHGDPQPTCQQRVRWLIDHHEKRCAEATGIIKENPGRTGLEIITSLRWSVPFDSWDLIPPIQRSVIIAEGLAVLDHLVTRGTIERFVDGNTALYCENRTNK